MANIKSAKKRIKVIETKTARNKAIRSKVKTSIKKVEAAVATEHSSTCSTEIDDPLYLRRLSQGVSRGS